MENEKGGTTPPNNKTSVAPSDMNAQQYEGLLRRLCDVDGTLTDEELRRKDAAWRVCLSADTHSPEFIEAERIYRTLCAEAKARYRAYADPIYEDALVDAVAYNVRQIMRQAHEPAAAAVCTYEPDESEPMEERAAELLDWLQDEDPIAWNVVFEYAGRHVQNIIAFQCDPALNALRKVVDARVNGATREQRFAEEMRAGYKRAQSLITAVLECRWDIDAVERLCAIPRIDEKGPSELPVLQDHPFPPVFVAIPAPCETFVMTNRVYGTITGISERGRGARLLARNRIVELDEGAGCSTIVTTMDADWAPMRSTDVWPYQRLVTMVDVVRRQYGPDIFPLYVPIETGCHWAFGTHDGGGARARETRAERLREILRRLRQSASVDMRGLVARGRVDVERVADELGLPVSLLRGVVEAPLMNTEFWEPRVQVNRNGAIGACFRVMSWPLAYPYSMATGQAQRIPDALTELIEPGTRRVREGNELLAVKPYLLARIVEMYRERSVGHVISFDGLYAWVGAEDKDARRCARTRCERYLKSWTIPRLVYGMTPYPFIRDWARVENGYKITLVRGGLKRMLGV